MTPTFSIFSGYKDTYADKDFETAVLRKLESFILELGTDFSFIAHQKRTTNYYMDLLFYHRGLNRLVVIDLKMGKFQASNFWSLIKAASAWRSF